MRKEERGGWEAGSPGNRGGTGQALPLAKDKFLGRLFLYDDDGYQSYCSVCCSGDTLLICENPDCTR